MAPFDLTVTRLAQFNSGAGGAGSEVGAFSGGRFFVTNAADNTIDVFTYAGGKVATIDLAGLPGYGGVTSVAARDGLVAVSYAGLPFGGAATQGAVALFDAVTLAPVNLFSVGSLPDHVMFSADGAQLYTANEGEPVGANDPAGSISVITLGATPNAPATVETVGFAAFDDQVDALRAAGVRLFPGRLPSTDFEPEYIAIDPLTGNLLVTLQEANAVAVFDIASKSFSAIHPLGTVDHALAGNGIDASDRDDAINIANWPVQGLRMPDSIAAFAAGGQTYYVTANEGDARNEAARVSTLTLDPTAFPDAAALQDAAALGRLNVSTIDGDIDGDGDFDQLFSYGARSFTIFDANGAVVFDSGDQFEQFIAANFPARFNSTNASAANPAGAENRSDDKGPEPEGVAIAQVDGRTLAVIGLERDSGVMIYDVTDPANVAFVTYIDGVSAGDLAPESITVIPADQSATGRTEIIVTAEASGTTSVYELTTLTPTDPATLTGGDDDAPAPAFGFDLQITEIWSGNTGSPNLTADWLEITNRGAEAWVAGVSPDLYYDDDSSDPNAADIISGLTGIAPGESVIVVIDDATAVATFRSVWGAVVDLGAVQVGNADGAGLGAGGDAATLFVGGPALDTIADVEAIPGAALGRSYDSDLAAFSEVANAAGAVATLALGGAAGDQPAVGSPGFAVSFDTTASFRLQLFHASDQEAAIPALDDAPGFSAVLAALRAQDVAADATLTLSSGDAYIPGVFASASEVAYGATFRGDILVQNALGFDAISFGNHEFDLGTAAILKAIAPADGFSGALFPYLSGNLDFSADGNLSSLVVADGGAPVAASITGSVVIARGGAQIGVVSATTPTLRSISSPGAVEVNPAPFGGTPTEAELDALAALIQADVDALLAANPDMNKVILLAHMQRIDIEQALAPRLTGVDIIVAGGSNTRLFDENDAIRPGDTDQGPYPIFSAAADGAPVAIVNTDGNYKYVGRLVVDFDENGEILVESYDAAVSGAFATDAAGVAALGVEAVVDPEVQAIVDALEQVIIAQDGAFFGVTSAFLNGARSSVRVEETNLGNLTADANLAYAQSVDDTVVLSLKNGGGIRNSIGEIVTLTGATEPSFLPPEGNALTGRPDGGVSQIAIANALSFNNSLALVTVTKTELKALLEHAVAASVDAATGAQLQAGRFPQVSGVEFSFDLSKPEGQRIVSAALVDADGVAYEALVIDGVVAGDPGVSYRMVTLGFLANGGDGYPFPTGPDANVVDLLQPGQRDGEATFADTGSEQDALAEYMRATFTAETPFAQADTPATLDERIQNVAVRADTVLADLPASGPVFTINEIDSDTPGVDVAEFVELYDGGLGGQSLDGLVLVFFNGNAANDASYRTIDLTGFSTDANGFFVVGNEGVPGVRIVFPSNGLQNGTDAVALYRAPASSFPDGASPTTDGLLDAIVYDTNDPVDAALLAALGLTEQVNEGGGAQGSAGDALARNPDGSGGFVAQAPTPGATNALDDGGPGGEASIDDAPTLISAIQGAGDVSPLVGQTVVIEAIVTGDFQNGDGDALRALGGFFAQEENEDADGDAATSEGVFVDDSALALTDVAEGDRVRVLGVVEERFGKTVIVAQAVRVEQAAAVEDIRTLAVSITLPDRAAREAFESMLVTFTEDLTFSESFNFEQFGELTLSRGGALEQFTQNNLPSVEGFALAEQERLDRTILIEDGLSGRRAAGDPILLPDGSPIDTASGVRMGQTVTDLTAIMDYDFSQYRLRVPAAETLDIDTASNPRPETPEDVGGRLKVASYNVLNYFTTIDSRGAEDLGIDAEGRTEFQRQQIKIVEAIVAIQADVLGLIEIENNGAAVADLVGAVNARLGEDRYAFVNTGIVGDDAITTAFIYNQQTVATFGDFKLLDTDAFIAPLTPGDQQNRPAIAQTFQEIATGETFTAAVNHFKSKGSSTGAAEDANQNDGQGASNATRLLAAAELARWLDTDPTGSGDDDFLILGDLNSYGMEDPIRALVDAGYTDLARAFVGDDVYSFRFSGQLGSLDYALANEGLLGQVTGATVWNINADEPVIYDYNIDSTFNPSVIRPSGLFDPTTPAANSDHDPVIIGLNLESAPVFNIVQGGDGADRLFGTEMADMLFGGAGNNTLVGGGGADVFVFDTLANGRRENNQIRDFEADVDFVDLGGAAFTFRETASGVFLTVEGDRDVIAVRGVTSIDQIQFYDDMIA